jgi:threonine dehydrogenase-like Zn-dependent dehydrogenase
MRAVRRGGTLSISGVHGGPVQMFPLGDLFDMQVTLRMGKANVLRWVPDIMPLLRDGDPLGVDDLATHEMALDDAPRAYAMFQAKEDGCIKVVLRPRAMRRSARRDGVRADTTTRAPEERAPCP